MVLLESRKNSHYRLWTLSNDSDSCAWNGTQWSQPTVSVKSYNGEGVEITTDKGMVVVVSKHQPFRSACGFSIAANSLKAGDILQPFFMPGETTTTNVKIAKTRFVNIDSVMFGFNEPFVNAIVFTDGKNNIQIGG